LGLGSEEARVRVTSLPYEDEDYDEGYDEAAAGEEFEEDEVAPPGNRRFEPEPVGVGRRPPPAFQEAPRVRQFDPEAEPFAALADAARHGDAGRRARPALPPADLPGSDDPERAPHRPPGARGPSLRGHPQHRRGRRPAGRRLAQAPLTGNHSPFSVLGPLSS